MLPQQLETLTPREYTLIMRAEVEADYDKLELESQIAIMYARANNPPPNKSISSRDLYKRPNDVTVEKSDIEVKIEQKAHTEAFINNLDLSVI